MANDQNVYSLGQFYPGVGKNAGVDLANEVKTGTQLPVANITTNGITSAQMSTSLLQRTLVSLTSANILGMNATPVQVLAAPGAGLVHVIHKVCLHMNPTATQYANGGNVVLNYATGPVAAIAVIAASVINGASATKTVRNGIDAAAVANDAIVITNASAAFDTGTGTAVLEIWHSIGSAA